VAQDEGGVDYEVCNAPMGVVVYICRTAGQLVQNVLRRISSLGKKRPQSCCLSKTTIDQSFILSEFDSLVNSGTVIFSDKEEIIEQVDGGLKVCLTPCLNMNTYPQGA
jgi:hypothetical protein